MRALISALISSHLGFSATDEIDDLEASILNRQDKEQIILTSQPRLVPKDLFKQLQDMPVLTLLMVMTVSVLKRISRFISDCSAA